MRGRPPAVLAFDTAVGEVVGAVRAQCHGAVVGGADEQPTDVRVRPEGGDEVGMALVQLVERRAPGLLQQVDEVEIPQAENDDALVADVILRAPTLGHRCLGGGCEAAVN